VNPFLPYCGAPPLPATLWERFNLDPTLISILVALAVTHALILRRQGRDMLPAVAGWAVAGAALISPLCALSVSLFSARVGQHMVLILIAAPLIALRLPTRPPPLWPSVAAFFVALWFWHMPNPYALTFSSTALYWTMHLSVLAGAVSVWTNLLAPSRQDILPPLAAGTATSIQMGLLGAVLSMAGRPLFTPHYFTTTAWGLTPLQDQQLGGAIMWVPGIFLFLWVALRSGQAALQDNSEARA
jgi:putative membrane protein